MQSNTIKGKTTELHCQLDFISRNFLISQPIVVDSKYDFLVDICGKIFRIQCKSASISADGKYITLKTKTTNIRTMKDSFYSKEDIDYFYSCYENKSYLIPVEDAGHGETRLRFFSDQSNNPNIRWASNYELDVMLQKIKGEISN